MKFTGVPYRHEWRVRFEDVDRIGFINYPRVFDALQNGVEDLLIEIDHPYHRLIPEDEIGLPIVHAEADYILHIEHGDDVIIEITPSLGASSITFEGTGHVSDNRAFEAVQKQVTIDAETSDTIPVPEDLRSGLEHYTDDTDQSPIK